MHKALVTCFLALLVVLSSADTAAQNRPSTPSKGTTPTGTVVATKSIEPRLALVIGNAAYRTAPLANPVKDARAMSRALSDAGFTVISREDASRKEMATALREFGDMLKKSGGVGLVYYAGHGVQIKGGNYLIPVDASIEREDEVAYASIDASQILDKMQSANNRLNILILDACRNNPYASGSRSAGRGLAQMDAPVGTLIAFSTAPGMVASDGQGENGLYTQHLLGAIRTPGIRIEDVFKRVRSNVRRDSGGSQIPWESTSLEGDFIFVPALARPVAQTNAAASSAPVDRITEIPVPMPKVGDTWTWQTIDLFSGSVVRRDYTGTIKRVTANEIHFGETVYDSSWNTLRRLRDGKVTATWSPARNMFDFPLRAGKTWSGSSVYEDDVFKSNHEVSFRVVGQERIAVPAGAFDTLRVEGHLRYKTSRKDGKGSGEGTGTWRYWFSRDVGRYVALEYEETNWKGIINRRERIELVSFSRAK